METLIHTVDAKVDMLSAKQGAGVVLYANVDSIGIMTYDAEQSMFPILSYLAVTQTRIEAEPLGEIKFSYLGIDFSTADPEPLMILREDNIELSQTVFVPPWSDGRRSQSEDRPKYFRSKSYLWNGKGRGAYGVPIETYNETVRQVTLLGGKVFRSVEGVKNAHIAFCAQIWRNHGLMNLTSPYQVANQQTFNNDAMALPNLLSPTSENIG